MPESTNKVVLFRLVLPKSVPSPNVLEELQVLMD